MEKIPCHTWCLRKPIGLRQLGKFEGCLSTRCLLYHNICQHPWDPVEVPLHSLQDHRKPCGANHPEWKWRGNVRVGILVLRKQRANKISHTHFFHLRSDDGELSEWKLTSLALRLFMWNSTKLTYQQSKRRPWYKRTRRSLAFGKGNGSHAVGLIREKNSLVFSTANLAQRRNSAGDIELLEFRSGEIRLVSSRLKFIVRLILFKVHNQWLAPRFGTPYAVHVC